MTHATKTLLILLFSSYSLCAHALSSDRHAPIEIEADRGSVSQSSQTTEFSGNVSVKQGTMYINAQNVRVVKNGNNQHFTASGSPVQFGQTLERHGQVRGRAQRVEYRSETGVVTLTGGAHIERGSDKASGHTISYNTRNETYTIAGSGSGRVSIVIQPQK